MSDREVSKICTEMVDGGLSLALLPGRSTPSDQWQRHYHISKYVHLPCERTAEHPFKICWMVGHGLFQREHLECDLNLHLWFIGAAVCWNLPAVRVGQEVDHSECASEHDSGPPAW